MNWHAGHSWILIFLTTFWKWKLLKFSWGLLIPRYPLLGGFAPPPQAWARSQKHHVRLGPERLRDSGLKGPVGLQVHCVGVREVWRLLQVMPGTPASKASWFLGSLYCRERPPLLFDSSSQARKMRSITNYEALGTAHSSKGPLNTALLWETDSKVMLFPSRSVSRDFKYA